MRTRPRRTAEPALLQTAHRLRRLRTNLTLLLLGVNVVGLAGMGVVALAVDSRQRNDVLTADLRRTGGTAVALLNYESGALQLDKLFANSVAQGSAAVYVFEANRTDVSLVFAHPAQLGVIGPQALLEPARLVHRSGAELATTVIERGGAQVHLLAVPFRHEVTGAVAGAVVVVGDPAPARVQHTRLALALVAGGLVFTILAWGAGYGLVRRGTKPIADALAQQERFVADAAHELRTPLTVIRAVSEAALAEPGSQPAALRTVLRSSDRLADSVTALLARAQLVAGLRHLERRPFRLDQLAEDVLTETVRDPHRGAMELVPTIELGDPALVRIAIRNLVQNAVQHGRVGDDPAIVTLLVGPGVVRVRDSGSGLTGVDGAVEGQRFHSRSPDGIGLGLAIARWVAELHGGSLHLKRVAGAGMEATLSLNQHSAT
jgi:signal transduction histidine kinase